MKQNEYETDSLIPHDRLPKPSYLRILRPYVLPRHHAISPPVLVLTLLLTRVLQVFITQIPPLVQIPIIVRVVVLRFERVVAFEVWCEVGVVLCVINV